MKKGGTGNGPVRGPVGPLTFANPPVGNNGGIETRIGHFGAAFLWWGGYFCGQKGTGSIWSGVFVCKL